MSFILLFLSEHTTLSDDKGSGGQRRTDGVFSLHRQRTQARQFPALASGEAFLHLPAQDETLVSFVHHNKALVLVCTQSQA